MTDASKSRYLDRRSAPHISTLILMAGASAMAINLFLPSLPAMAVHFGAEYSVMQLAVALFLATNAVMQIFIGPLSDKFGRRPVALGGIALFCLATAGCLAAPNITVFLIFRMMQATIAASLVLSRAVVGDIYSRDKAASMLGYVTMGMSLVPMLSPMIGGFLDQTFGWQACFWALLLMGLGLFTVVYLDLGETKESSGLTLVQQFREYPELLTSPRFWGYCMASALSAGAFFAYLGGAPYIGTEMYHLTPAVFGMFTGAPAIGYFVGNFTTARMAAKVGVNLLIIWGSVIMACGLAGSILLHAIGLGGPFVFFGAMIFVGMGNGLTMPNATSGMLSVRPHLAGTASGLGGTIMIGGGAMLSILAGVLLQGAEAPFPLLWLQMGCGLAGLVAIYLVIRREKSLAAAGL
ncbi:multidrug effflux MFS transporter [Pseudooceanicola sp. 502str34]|uniref:multidrug effflux MFS transporter n=1 Tax=Maritimibacter alkaliphilus TaxID=404236 RepID=UPI001C9372AC|nr:multidrug effflux MFS transporter [Maritimibacter alkaliphilus]MBY6092134.1 multidrug effflux MFS transporter [Maritimibacter alkaliphilus]